MTTRRVMSHVLAFTVVSTAFLFALPVVAVAQDVVDQEEVEEEEAQEEEAPEENPFEDFERLVEGAEVSPGFFDLYTKEGRLYLAVPADRLGQDFLMDMRVARGVGAAGLFGGTTLRPTESAMDLMAFEKHGDNVYLVQRPHRIGRSGRGCGRHLVRILRRPERRCRGYTPGLGSRTGCDELVPLRSIGGGPAYAGSRPRVQRPIGQHEL